jgi:Pyridoxamine 5'-phosphate oxidase
MKLTEDDALARLSTHDHGVLCTLHAERGIDAVPVVYVTDTDSYVGIPVDRVKPKSSLRLQRERNLEADGRATLLIENWDRHDWSQLWWVRAELRWENNHTQHDQHNQRIQPSQHVPDREATLADELCRRFPHYRIDQPFAKVLVLRIVSVSGWAASSAG